MAATAVSRDEGTQLGLQLTPTKNTTYFQNCDYTFDDMVIPAGTAGDSDGAFNLASDIGTADYQYLIDSADGKKSVIWVWTGTQPCFLMLLFQNSSKQNPPAEPKSNWRFFSNSDNHLMPAVPFWNQPSNFVLFN